MKLGAKRFLAVSALILVFVTFLTAYYYMGKNNLDSSHFISLNAGWCMTVDGKTYEDVDLEVFVPQQQHKRSIISMSRTMPEEIIKNPVLKLYTIHSAFEIFFDNELYYTSCMEEYEQGKVVGYGLSFINIPDDYAGKDLRIVLYVNEDKAFTSIDAPFLYNENYLYKDFIIQNRMPLAINMFLFVFGLCLFPISIVFSVKNGKFFKLVCVSIFSVVVSLWSICSYDLISLFTYNFKVKAYLEFISLYICPLYVLLYFRSEMMNGHKWMKWLFATTEMIQVLYLALSFSLQFFNVVHLSAMLSGEHIIILLVAVNMVVAIVYEMKNSTKKKRPVVFGIIVFIAIGALDMARYNLGKYVFSDRVFHYVSMLCIGTLILVITQIVDFCQEISNMLSDAIRQSALEEMAYTDSLTEISNRRRCEKEFEKMDMSDKTYGMICFDLNNLKKANDILGHEKGDLLIRSFAEVLNETYGEVGIPCRMGGDEFIVLFPDVTGINLRELYDRLKENIIRKNSEIEGVRITTAIGYSDNSVHKEWKSADIYRDADRKMYNNKMAMKAQRV
ncbi:MAG: GGDEF domain-containing protein [Lachnospiraceae bacterium]|nr:GGDEF domain-containing protein [Lachnospiraceae bacterium]